MPAPPPRTISHEEADRGMREWRRLGLAIDTLLVASIGLFLYIIFSGQG